MSESEFRALAAELAPKVDLFKDAWEKDPAAEFYGGTSRDFLYWLKGKFKDARNPAAAERVVRELRARPSIDVREFIVGESDVDVVSAKGDALGMRADDYGVRKLDVVSPELFDPKSEAGISERLQGYVPAEKIRLQRTGFVTGGDFGDGLGEIYRGRLSVHFTAPELFAQSKYARSGENHPILLALRYLRLQAVNYFQTHGRDYPNRDLLLSGMEPESRAAVARVVKESLENHSLKPFLEKPRFRSWLNGSIQKAFRSYTNPTAAMELLKEFKADQLGAYYGSAVDPINQYLFAKAEPSPGEVAQRLAALGTKPEELYLPVKQAFPDGYLYHGTRSEEAFRAILFQGTLASDGGSGGAGLYGVNEAHKTFAESWARDRERLVRIPVSERARIVDITKGEGERLWKKFGGGQAFDVFAEKVGADILLYPYTTEAFVVKNGGVLGHPEGVYRPVRLRGEVKEAVRNAKSFREVLEIFAVNRSTTKEMQEEIAELNFPLREVAEALGERKHLDIYKLLEARPEWLFSEEIYPLLEPRYTFGHLSFAEGVFRHPLIGQYPDRVYEFLAKHQNDDVLPAWLVENVLSREPFLNDPRTLELLLPKERLAELPIRLRVLVAEKIMGHPDWVPDHARVVEMLQFRPTKGRDELRRALLHSVFLRPWSKIYRAEFKDALHASGDVSLGARALASPAWAGDREMLDAYRAGEFNISKQIQIAKHVLPAWPGPDVKLFREVLEDLRSKLNPERDGRAMGEQVLEYLASVLRDPAWKGQGELVDEILAQSVRKWTEVPSVLLRFVFKEPHWHDRPDLIIKTINRCGPACAGEVESALLPALEYYRSPHLAEVKEAWRRNLPLGRAIKEHGACQGVFRWLTRH